MPVVPVSAIFIAIVIHTLWGGNVVGGKLALQAFPPFWSAAFRFILGVLTVWLWCRWRSKDLWPKPHEWRPLLMISLYFTVQISLMNMGFDATSGVNAAILISTYPLFAAIFAHFMLASDRQNVASVVGLVLAFGGVVLTLLVTGEETASATMTARLPGLEFGNRGDWLCLASACLLGFRLIASASAMQEVDSYRLAFWQMLFSIPLFVLLGSVFEEILWDKVDASAVAGVAYQGVVIAGAGFMVTLWLMSRYRPSLMTSFGFIAPISGVLLSIVMLGESSSIWLIVSLALVACGLLLLTKKSGHEKSP